MSKAEAYKPRPGTKPALFLKLARPDDEGFSRKVFVSEFTGKYDRLQFGNGGDWCRDDGTLGKHYNIVRHKTGNKITAVELQGRKKQSVDKPIPKPIRDRIIVQRCAVLAIGQNIQADHRDGRRDDPRLSDPGKVTIHDFQPLSQAVNSAKRQHCKVCRETNQRFDATQLGYSRAQIKGNGEYRGTCVGCYWHDPIRFNRDISSGNAGPNERAP